MIFHALQMVGAQRSYFVIAPICEVKCIVADAKMDGRLIPQRKCQGNLPFMVALPVFQGNEFPIDGKQKDLVLILKCGDKIRVFTQRLTGFAAFFFMHDNLIKRVCGEQVPRSRFIGIQG